MTATHWKFTGFIPERRMTPFVREVFLLLAELGTPFWWPGPARGNPLVRGIDADGQTGYFWTLVGPLPEEQRPFPSAPALPPNSDIPDSCRVDEDGCCVVCGRDVLGSPCCSLAARTPLPAPPPPEATKPCLACNGRGFLLKPNGYVGESVPCACLAAPPASDEVSRRVVAVDRSDGRDFTAEAEVDLHPDGSMEVVGVQRTPPSDEVRHELKTEPGPFAAVLDGRKRFEVRRADRPFTDGDVLLLREWSPERGYSGREIKVRITYRVRPGLYGLPPDLCVLGIAPIGCAPPPARDEVREAAEHYREAEAEEAKCPCITIRCEHQLLLDKAAHDVAAAVLAALSRNARGEARG